MISVRRRSVDLDRVNKAVRDLELPEAVFTTAPWQPRSLVEQGSRQWLRCAGAALLWDLDEQVGLELPWGVPPQRVPAVLADLDRGRSGS